MKFPNMASAILAGWHQGIFCARLATGWGSLFLGLAIVAFFFAVNAAAIGLSIHAQPSGFVNTGFPPVSKILVIKGYAHRFSHGLANGSDLVVLLEAAVEQGWW
jgi:hypothetical protein